MLSMTSTAVAFAIRASGVRFAVAAVEGATRASLEERERMACSMRSQIGG